MFANGEEYRCFLNRECGSCSFYVHYTDATVDNPVCNIEESIAFTAFTGDTNHFPYQDLEENGSKAVYKCKKRQEGQKWATK